ncbi:hypothetical protein RND71_030496 [Anisodus tanguticus]|uniref:Uncharacterized protein n=1 Tax=Anisodus tanguticus TaxID=243964 RepID=A0AAE1RHN6_9SOLA|nr:hypothetical protein RND71_030496 [Anisodus tanguticus]
MVSVCLRPTDQYYKVDPPPTSPIHKAWRRPNPHCNMPARLLAPRLYHMYVPRRTISGGENRTCDPKAAKLTPCQLRVLVFVNELSSVNEEQKRDGEQCPNITAYYPLLSKIVIRLKLGKGQSHDHMFVSPRSHFSLTSSPKAQTHGAFSVLARLFRAQLYPFHRVRSSAEGPTCVKMANAHKLIGPIRDKLSDARHS